MANSNSNDASYGDIEFHITERVNFGFSFDIRDQLPPNMDTMARITSINDHQIKGMLLSDVQKLTRGPVGSTVKFGLVTTQGHQITIVLERKETKALVNEWNSRSRGAFKAALDVLDFYDNNDLPTEYRNAAATAESVGLEPLATGTYRAAECLSRKWMDDSSATAIVMLISVAEHYDRVGHFSQADEAVRKSVKSIGHISSAAFFFQFILLRFAKFLNATERYSEADAVFKKVVELADASISPPQAAYRAYSEFLVQQNRLVEAEVLQEKILRLNEKLRTEIDLELAADFYSAYGKADKAMAIYADLVGGKSEIDKLSPNARVYFIRSSYKLATLLENVNEYDQAITTLRKVLDYYNEKLSIAQQDDLERLPGDSKPATDIERKLGLIKFKSGDAASASVYQESAVKRIEGSLGQNSPYLRAPLLELSNSYAATGKVKEAEEAKARALALESLPVEEAAGEIQAKSRRIILAAYKSIMAKDAVTAGSAVDAMLHSYEDSCNKPASKEQRNRLMVCLSYFTSLYIDKGNFEEAKKLIERITTITAKHGEDQPLMLALITEKALFAKQLEFDEENCWQTLENSLLLASQQSFRVPRQENSSAGLADQSKQLASEALRRWAMAYSFNDDYKRANLILQRAVHLSLLASESGGINAINDQTNLPPVLLADLAIAATKIGDSAKASSYVAQLMSGRQNLGAATILKIAHLAEMHVEMGNIKASENLLHLAIREIKYSGSTSSRIKVVVPGLFQWKLAEIQRQGGQPAHASITAAMAQYQSAPPLKLLLLSANTNFANGLFLEAAHQYILSLKYFQHLPGHLDPGMNDLKTQILTKALKAADRSQKLPDNELCQILVSLGDCLLNSSRHEAAKQYERALALLPPESKDKTTVLMKLAQLSQQQQGKVNEQILAPEKVIEIAAKSGSAFTHNMWLAQALTELRAKQTDKGLASIRQALNLYKNLTKKKNTFAPLFTSRENTVVAELLKLKLASEAENLIKDATAAVVVAYGPNSDEAAISLVELANLFALEGHTAKAIAVATDVLNIYALNDAQLPLNAHSSRHEALNRLYDTTKLIAEMEVEKAIDLLTKLLAVQTRKLPAKNAQLAYTLHELGCMYKQCGRLDKAEAFYKRAAEINQELYGNGRMSIYYVGEYADILRRQGKDAEADRITTFAGDQKSDLEVSRQLNELQSAARNLESSGQIEQARSTLEKAYETAKLESPYGHSAIEALRNVAKFYFRQKQFPQAEKRYSQMLEIFELDVSTSPRTRTATMLELVKVQIALGKNKDASEMLKKAKHFDANIRCECSSARELLAYAELEVELGQTAEAVKDLEASENLSSAISDSRRLFDFHSVASLWRRLGRADRADIAQAKADEQREKQERDRPTPEQWRAQRREWRKLQQQNSKSEKPLQSNSTSSEWEKGLGLYMAELEKRIFRAWQPTRSTEGHRVTVKFDVSQNGSVSNLLLVQSSGSSEIDEQAFQAIRNAAPFRPLQNGSKAVETFEINFKNQPGQGHDGAVRRL